MGKKDSWGNSRAKIWTWDSLTLRAIYKPYDLSHFLIQTKIYSLVGLFFPPLEGQVVDWSQGLFQDKHTLRYWAISQTLFAEFWEEDRSSFRTRWTHLETRRVQTTFPSLSGPGWTITSQNRNCFSEKNPGQIYKKATQTAWLRRTEAKMTTAYAQQCWEHS